MVTAAVAEVETATSDGDYAEARRRLKEELEKIADQVRFLDPDRPEWRPLLDSRRVVCTVLVLEDLFPGVKIPPDKVVKKGGYNGVDEAVEDVVRRHRREVAEAAQKKLKVRK